jgi:tetratricopeptide (TPR) repeat protein
VSTWPTTRIFLAFTAMMRGRSKESIASAREMVEGVPDEFLKEFGPVADGYMAIVCEALMRFGKWNELLEEPQPRGGFPLSTALWHFTRAVAFTALKSTQAASAEQAKFIAAADKAPKDATFGNNSASDILSIAKLVLRGEMAAATGDFKAAGSALAEAVKLEDNLQYNEPPDWIQPVRHTLGAVLLRAGDPPAAEKVYREDLERYPGNGWSLMGLRDALNRQGKSEDAKKVDHLFEKAWAKADVRPTATCYCQAAER